MSEQNEISEDEFRELLSKGVVVDKIAYEKLKTRLKEAEKVIDFYADKNNWIEIREGNFILDDDYISDNFYGRSGGKRASEYKQKYGGENE